MKSQTSYEKVYTIKTGAWLYRFDGAGTSKLYDTGVSSAVLTIPRVAEFDTGYIIQINLDTLCDEYIWIPNDLSGWIQLSVDPTWVVPLNASIELDTINTLKLKSLITFECNAVLRLIK